MINMDIKALTSIKRLNVPDNLNAAAVDKLCLVMDDFVQTLPKKTYEFTRIFSIRDFTYLARRLHELGTVLDSMYAESLADTCSELISSLGNGRQIHLEGQMQRFLTELLTLSIDIQTASYKPPTASEPKPASAASAVSASPAPTATVTAAGQNDGARKTILAVDDMPLMLKTLKSMIEDDRFIFHGLNSGAGALNYLQKHEPDLFILDIEMPEINGYELLAKIREMGQVAPVIFLTGNATREYVMRAIELGADGFLAKPVEKHLVWEKIKELLG